MADKTIGDLTPKATPAPADLLEIEDAITGNSRRTTAQAIADLGGAALTPPIAADFTEQNFGTGTTTDVDGYLKISPQLDDALRNLVMTPPSAPYDIYMHLNMTVFSSSASTAFNTNCGIILRNSSTGKAVVWSFRYQRVSASDKRYAFMYENWNGSSTTVSQANNIVPMNWLRVNVTSTDITAYGSVDGKDWVQLETRTIASFVGTIDQVGIANRASSGTTIAHNYVDYFSFTAPFT